MGTSPRPNIFYGWKLSFLSLFSNFLILGSSVYLMNAFIEPFTALYGWNRGEMGLIMGIGSFCGLASTPLFSSLAMRASLRSIMLGGAIAGGLSLFLLGQFSNIWLFGINFAVLWIAGQACGGPITNALMSNWFIRYRGRAFGIASCGMSCSGAILPFAAFILLKFFTVQTSTEIIGIFVLVTLVPAVWFFVRDTPESMGLLPDGVKPQGESVPHKDTDTSEAPSINELLRSPLVWRIGFAFTIMLTAGAGVMSQLKPRFSDLGFNDVTAMGFMCATAFCTACSKYVWGWLADRFSPVTTTRILCLYSAVAFLLAFLPPSLPALAAFSLFCGLAMGGYWTCLPAVVVNVFGRTHFMGVYRVISLFIFFKAVGYIIMGKSHQYTGSYDAAFIVFCALFVLAFLLMPKEGIKYKNGL